MTALALIPSKPTPLSAAEKELTERLFAFGTVAYDEAGMDAAARAAFVANPLVREYLDRLDIEFSQQDIIQARALFVARRTLLRMLPMGLQVMVDALKGPVYERDSDGHILFDKRGNPLVVEMGPTLGQRDIAMDLLSRLGLAPKGEKLPIQPVNVNVLLNQNLTPITINYPKGATEQDKVISRERMRVAITKLSSKVKAGKKSMDVALVKSKKIKKTTTTYDTSKGNNGNGIAKH